jgi:hypothetical protein
LFQLSSTLRNRRHRHQQRLRKIRHLLKVSRRLKVNRLKVNRSLFKVSRPRGEPAPAG